MLVSFAVKFQRTSAKLIVIMIFYCNSPELPNNNIISWTSHQVLVNVWSHLPFPGSPISLWHLIFNVSLNLTFWSILSLGVTSIPNAVTDNRKRPLSFRPNLAHEITILCISIKISCFTYTKLYFLFFSRPINS